MVVPIPTLLTANVLERYDASFFEGLYTLRFFKRINPAARSEHPFRTSPCNLTGIIISRRAFRNAPTIDRLLEPKVINNPTPMIDKELALSVKIAPIL